MDESVVNSLRSLEDTGEKQYQEFVKTVFEDFTRSIYDPNGTFQEISAQKVN